MLNSITDYRRNKVGVNGVAVLVPIGVSLVAHIILALLLFRVSIVSFDASGTKVDFQNVRFFSEPENATEVVEYKDYLQSVTGTLKGGIDPVTNPKGVEDRTLRDFNIPATAAVKTPDHEKGVPIIARDSVLKGDRPQYRVPDYIASRDFPSDNVPNVPQKRLMGESNLGLSRESLLRPKFESLAKPDPKNSLSEKKGFDPSVRPTVEKPSITERVTREQIVSQNDFVPAERPEIEGPSIADAGGKTNQKLQSLAPDLKASFKTYYEDGNPLGWFELTVSLRESSKLKTIPKNALILADVSLSIPEAEILNTKGAVSAYLKALNPADKFNVMIFSNETKALFQKFESPGSGKHDYAAAFIGRVRKQIKTDIHEVLKAASRILENDRELYQIFLISDGAANEGISDVRRILNDFATLYHPNTSIFTFNSGIEKANLYLLDLLAYRGRGYFQNVPDINSQMSELKRFLLKYNSPVISSVYADYGNLRVSDTYPAAMPNLYREEPIVIHGRCERGKKVSLRIVGSLDSGENREFVLVEDLPEHNPVNRPITREWARGKIHYLIARLCNTRLARTINRDEMIAEIKRLGDKYEITTPYNIPGVKNK